MRKTPGIQEYKFGNHRMQTWKSSPMRKTSRTIQENKRQFMQLQFNTRNPVYGTCLHFGTGFQAFSDPANLPPLVAQQAKMTSYTANRYIFLGRIMLGGKPPNPTTTRNPRQRCWQTPKPEKKKLFAKPQTLKKEKKKRWVGKPYTVPIRRSTICCWLGCAQC